jgi:hypothetical protein
MAQRDVLNRRRDSFFVLPEGRNPDLNDNCFSGEVGAEVNLEREKKRWQSGFQEDMYILGTSSCKETKRTS